MHLTLISRYKDIHGIPQESPPPMASSEVPVRVYDIGTGRELLTCPYGHRWFVDQGRDWCLDCEKIKDKWHERFDWIVLHGVLSGCALIIALGIIRLFASL